MCVGSLNEVQWCQLYATQTKHDNGGRRGDGIPAARSVTFCFLDNSAGLCGCISVVVSVVQKLWFWFLWRSCFHDLSDATDWPIGGMQSTDVTFSKRLGSLETPGEQVLQGTWYQVLSPNENPQKQSQVKQGQTDTSGSPWEWVGDSNVWNLHCYEFTLCNG